MTDTEKEIKELESQIKEERANLKFTRELIGELKAYLKNAKAKLQEESHQKWIDETNKKWKNESKRPNKI